MKVKNYKILLTGGAGFIGSQITDLLVNEGYELIILDDLSSGKIENINKKTRFYQININNPCIEKIFNSEKPDYVCHHAAQISVARSIDNPVLDANSNIIGLLNLLKFSIRNRVKGFIFASSGGAVYGDCGSFPITKYSSFSNISLWNF